MTVGLSCVDLLPHSYYPIISQKLTKIIATHKTLKFLNIWYTRYHIEVHINTCTGTIE